MKEKFNTETRGKLILIAMVAIVILLILFLILEINHGRKINPDTVKITPQEFMVGTELEEPENISLESAYLVHSEEISFADMLLDFGRNIATSTIKQLEMLDNYMGLLEDIDSITIKEQVNMKALVIPAHSVYSGTKGMIIDESELENTFNLLGLNGLWFSNEMHIYAWHKEYKLFNKTEKVENHYILIYHNTFIYLRTQHTNNKKLVMDLFGGKIAK